MANAAVYLRSSKDRHDVSIASQERELQKLAKSKDLQIVREYVDVVESAKNEFRPAFQELMRDVRSPARGWDTLLTLDTSRLSTRRYVSLVFKHDAKKNGVQILYAKMPEVDPITNVLLESVMEALDEYHSLVSREKGLAGMAENVRQGFRAGGRAPRGYELQHIETGAIRDGQPVTKSKLRPSDDARWVGTYLRRRATGEPRAHVRRDMGLKISVSTLIGMEWNALTYAGHTVWNVHAERDGGGYVGGHKRRPRDDWHICRDTHEALISEEEAEGLIEALENSNISKAISKAKAAGSPYLLTPLLQTPEGQQWTGDRRRYYRLKNKRGERSSSVPLEPLQGAVLKQVMADAQSPEFVHELAAEARRVAHTDDPAKPLRQQFEKLEQKVAKAGELALKLEDPEPMLKIIETTRRKQKALTEEIQSLDKESAVRNALANITDEQVATILKDAVEPKALLNTVVSRITLDPDTHECQIHYQLPMWLNVASPRGFEPLLPP